MVPGARAHGHRRRVLRHRTPGRARGPQRPLPPRQGRPPTGQNLVDRRRTSMDLDLSDPTLLLRDDVLDDPRRFYDKLRREAPIWQIPGQDTYLVSDPRLIREAVGRPEDFSSNLVSLLHDDGQGCPVRVPAWLRSATRSTCCPRPIRRCTPGTASCSSPTSARPRVAELEPAIERSSTSSSPPSWPRAARRRRRHVQRPGPRPDHLRADRAAADGRRRASSGASSDTGALLDGVTDLDGHGPGRRRRAGAHGLRPTATCRTRSPAPPSTDPACSACSPRASRPARSPRTRSGTCSSCSCPPGPRPPPASWRPRSRRSPATRSCRSGCARTRIGIPDAIEDILRDDGPFQFHYRWTPADTEPRRRHASRPGAGCC